MIRRLAAVLLAAAPVLCAVPADAWGASGHRIVDRVAMATLPEDAPAFLTTPHAVATIVALSTELDELKGGGESLDHDEDPAHFLNLGDDHKVAATVALTSLPPDMERYATALQSAGTDPYKAGYLPYAIADGWERLRKDFAYWRVFDYLASHGKPSDRAAFATARALREQTILSDIGVWSHYVGDGSQPLHVTVHYNDRGAHARFEGGFIQDHVTAAEVQKQIPPGGPRAQQHLVTQRELLAEIGEYLTATNNEVGPLYGIDRHGGFRKATPDAIAFATTRIADGARELRDLIVEAYDNSLYETAGYPPLRVKDVLDGKVTPLAGAFDP